MYLLLSLLLSLSTTVFAFQLGSKTAWGTGCDYSGNDLSNVRTTADKCGDSCLRTPGCTHFTWSPHEGGTCWMKKDLGDPSATSPADSSVVCGYVLFWFDGGNTAWAHRCDFTGNDMGSVSCQAEECGGKCTGSCTHFTWSNNVCFPFGCAPAVDSKFEATFGCLSGSGCEKADWVDTSHVDGYTLPYEMWITTPDGSNCRGNYIDCRALDIGRCPVDDVGDLRVYNPQTKAVSGCFSPCGKLTTQQWNPSGNHNPGDANARMFCCPPGVTPQECSAGPVVRTKYVSLIHQTCPGVYSYAYDDNIGLLRCTAGSKYEIKFYDPKGVSFLATDSSTTTDATTTTDTPTTDSTTTTTTTSSAYSGAAMASFGGMITMVMLLLLLVVVVLVVVLIVVLVRMKSRVMEIS